MDPNTGWRGTGKIVTVHKHVAVVVNTPAYNVSKHLLAYGRPNKTVNYLSTPI